MILSATWSVRPKKPSLHPEQNLFQVEGKPSKKMKTRYKTKASEAVTTTKNVNNSYEDEQRIAMVRKWFKLAIEVESTPLVLASAEGDLGGVMALLRSYPDKRLSGESEQLKTYMKTAPYDRVNEGEEVVRNFFINHVLASNC